MTDANDVQKALDYVADLADGADRNTDRMLTSLYVMAEAIEDYQAAARSMSAYIGYALDTIGAAQARSERAEKELGMDS